MIKRKGPAWDWAECDKRGTEYVAWFERQHGLSGGEDGHRRYVLPTEVLDKLCEHKASWGHLAVVLQLERIWFRQRTKLNTVELRTVEIGGQKISRKWKSDLLQELERWELIRIEHRQTKAPLITLSWRLPDR
jgi:hypothetical protein